MQSTVDKEDHPENTDAQRTKRRRKNAGWQGSNKRLQYAGRGQSDAASVLTTTTCGLTSQVDQFSLEGGVLATPKIYDTPKPVFYKHQKWLAPGYENKHVQKPS